MREGEKELASPFCFLSHTIRYPPLLASRACGGRAKLADWFCLWLHTRITGEDTREARVGTSRAGTLLPKFGSSPLGSFPVSVTNSSFKQGTNNSELMGIT